MPRNLMSTVGTSAVDNLTGDNLIYQNRIEVLLPEGGEFHRGQLLVLDDDGVTASLPDADTEVIDCVLLDEVGETEEDIKAAASLTGQFNDNSVLWGGIPEVNRAAVVKKTRAERQLDIAPQHKAPYIQFGEVE